MRRGAALRLVVPAGGVAPRFSCLHFSRPAFSGAALMLPLEHMRSHVFPWALTYPQSLKFNRHHPLSLTQTHPKIEKNENFRASGYKTGHAVASRCYIR